MSFTKFIVPALTAMLAVASSANAAISFTNTYSVGTADFNAAAKVSGSAGAVPSASQVHVNGSAEFTGTLFGYSKKAVASVNGWNNPTTTQMGLTVTIDGIQLVSHTKSFGTSQGSYVAPTFSLFSVSRQFVVWGIPVVVMVDIDSVAKLAYFGWVNTMFSVNPANWKTTFTASGEIGATGTLTCGPGSDLIGAGVYGTTTLGKTQIQANRFRPYYGGAWDFDMTALLSYGGIEIGITGWVGNASVSAIVYTYDASSKTLKKINF